MQELTFESIKAIEKKWQAAWKKSKVFEANPSKKKKFFITFPYPYVNGAPHIGHSFSSFRVDTYARFKRAQGYNVLFPQGFHATGEPILGTIERLKKGDKTQIETFKLFGASDKDIEDFVKLGPEYVAKYWMNKWIEVLQLAGFSIDWRRTFITAITPQYNRFIEWQYNTLRKKGYVTQGTHPVVWCPHCQSPTGDHDRLKGEGESPIEFVLIKFKLPTGEVLPCATLRPETVYGVTNIWIDPNATYVWIKIGEEIWLVSEPTVLKLKDQLRNVTVVGEIKGEKLLGKEVENPVTKEKVPILPASFIDLHVGTGIVMSVPAHAPYDWIALEDLKKDPEAVKRYRLDEIKPRSIIATEGFGELPAKEACEKFGVKSQADKEKLEEATEEVYKKEYHKGAMKVDDFKNQKVSEVKEKIVEKFKEAFDSIWETSGEVVCRCGTRCHVKILENQWFLKFSDSEWKSKVKEAINSMEFYPSEIKQQFLNVVDWLKDKACARKTGLGTRLPWDKEWIVETLSDSTIYMAYYTISHLIKKYKIAANKLTDEVFDYVFLGKGNPKEVSKKSGIKLSVLKEMRKEFTYFYPVDLRSSGKDLVQNHLTFYLFHHVAIWPSKYWPKAIAVNGFVQVGGEKMSKSKGNVIPLKSLIEKYGSDIVRLNIVSSNEGLDDADWREENIQPLLSRINFLFNLIKDLKKCKKKKVEDIEKYLITRVESAIPKVTEYFQALKFRSAARELLFQVTNDLEWYIERVGSLESANGDVLRKELEKIVIMLSPLIPHLAEEMWKLLGKKGFVFQNGWPKAEKVYEGVEQKEKFIKDLLEDINEIKKIVETKPSKVYIIIAPSWKFEIYEKVLNNKKPELTAETASYYQKLMKKGKLEKILLSKKEQYDVLNNAKTFLSKKLNAEVEVVHAEDTNIEKKDAADVNKPAIYFI